MTLTDIIKMEAELNDDCDPLSTPALDVQIGGNHYKHMAIQPVEFIHRNGLGFIVGCAIKRLCRYQTKDPAKAIEDLQKAKHEIDLLIDFEQSKGEGQ